MNGPANLHAAASLVKACEAYGYQSDTLPLARVMLAVARLSNARKHIMMEHALGRRRIVTEEHQALGALHGHGLIRFAKPGQRETIKPSHSYATDEGREVIAYLLAQWAEALVKAGAVERSIEP